PASPRTSRAKRLIARPLTRPRPYLLDDDRFVYSDLTRRTGAIVLSSSHGDEPAFEYDDFHNSVFTKVVLLALTSSVADANQDGFLSTTELRNWVAKEVPR